LSLDRLTTAWRRGLKQLRRGLPMHVVATVAMAAALAVVGLAFSFLGQLDALSDRLSQQLKLIVFLKPIDQTAVSSLAGRISAWPEVAGLRSVSSAEALDRLRQLLGPQARLIDQLGPEVMPPLFELELKPEALEPTALTGLRQRLGELEGVEEVAYLEDLAQRFRDWLKTIRRLGLAVVLGLILTGLFIAFAAVRLSFLAHGQEIRILRLIGADDWFIRGPFLIQGAVQGLAAGLAAAVLLLVFDLGLGLASGPWRLRLLGLAGAGRVVLLGGLVGWLGAWLSLARSREDW